MCLALMGPGDTAIVPAPTFPIHGYSVMLASGNVIALDVREPHKFLENVAYTCEHLYPEAEAGDRQLPAQPVGDRASSRTSSTNWCSSPSKYKFLVISDFAYADICYDGYRPPVSSPRPARSTSASN